MRHAPGDLDNPSSDRCPNLDRSVAWPPQERLTLSRFITAQPETAKGGATTLSLLPMEIQTGDRFTDHGFE